MRLNNFDVNFFRSRRKADRTKQKRIRIRPCLSVCQRVEQICPYMLPADRAPAYPTQYAGEPTFLCLGKCTNTQQVKILDPLQSSLSFSCVHFPLFSFLTLSFRFSLSHSLILDPNIDETGNQLYKSNNGPSECCYEYCKVNGGLCSSTCDAIFNRNNETAIIASTSSSSTTSSSSLSSNVDDYDDDDENDDESSKQHANVTSITPRRPNLMENQKLYVKLDNGSYVLNDYTDMPDALLMLCPVITQSLPNVTLSTQQCSISQAHVTASTATTIKLSLLMLLASNLISSSIITTVVWNFKLLANNAVRRRRTTTTYNINAGS